VFKTLWKKVGQNIDLYKSYPRLVGETGGKADKAGSLLNLLHWTSARTIKETFVPPEECTYPFMLDE